MKKMHLAVAFLAVLALAFPSLSLAGPVLTVTFGGVACGERLGAHEGMVQPALDAGGALALDERLEVPGGRLELRVRGL